MTTPAEQPDERLGEQLSTYPVNTSRRWAQGIGFTIVGLVLLAAGVRTAVAYVADVNASGYAILPGAAMGLAFTLLGLGLLRLVQSIARPGERFVLYERGLLHQTRRREQAVLWEDIVGIRRVGQLRNTGVTRALGLDFRCQVLIRGAGTIDFNSFTQDADGLATVVNRKARAPRRPAGSG